MEKQDIIDVGELSRDAEETCQRETGRHSLTGHP